MSNKLFSNNKAGWLKPDGDLSPPTLLLVAYQLLFPGPFIFAEGSVFHKGGP